MSPPDDSSPSPAGSQPAAPTALDPATAAALLADVGFIASPDLPDRPGNACLLVALRPAPTLRHYDPELVEYWASLDGRGERRSLTGESRMPVNTAFSWGPIRIVDRLAVANEYLGFGGDLAVDRVDGIVVVVFTSPAPLLRRGGHSQGWDPGADSLGAFFGRLQVAVDYLSGFEARLAAATPVARYAAFLIDLVAQYRRSDRLRSSEAPLATLVEGEARRLRTAHRTDWLAGEALVREVLSSS